MEISDIMVIEVDRVMMLASSSLAKALDGTEYAVVAGVVL